MNPEPKTVTDITDPDAALTELAGIGGAPPASQPEPAPEPEVTEEDAVKEEAAEEPAQAEPEGEVPAEEPEGGT